MAKGSLPTERNLSKAKIAKRRDSTSGSPFDELSSCCGKLAVCSQRPISSLMDANADEAEWETVEIPASMTGPDLSPGTDLSDVVIMVEFRFEDRLNMVQASLNTLPLVLDSLETRSYYSYLEGDFVASSVLTLPAVNEDHYRQAIGAMALDGKENYTDVSISLVRLRDGKLVQCACDKYWTADGACFEGVIYPSSEDHVSQQRLEAQAAGEQASELHLHLSQIPHEHHGQMALSLSWTHVHHVEDSSSSEDDSLGPCGDEYILMEAKVASVPVDFDTVTISQIFS